MLDNHFNVLQMLVEFAVFVQSFVWLVCWNPIERNRSLNALIRLISSTNALIAAYIDEWCVSFTDWQYLNYFVSLSTSGSGDVNVTIHYLV